MKVERVGVHWTLTPASTTALSCPSLGPKKVPDGPGTPAKPAVIGSAENLYSCSQVAHPGESWKSQTDSPPLVEGFRTAEIPVDNERKRRKPYFYAKGHAGSASSR